ncbi:unnamed protein product, partial [Candidula unifasciata]
FSFLNVFCFCFCLAGSIWTGGNDLMVEGDWRWINNMARISPFTNCVCVFFFFSTDEHCLELRYNRGYKWNDIDCGENNVFICETQ